MSEPTVDELELELAEWRSRLLGYIAAMLDDVNAQPALRDLATSWIELDRTLDQVPLEQDLNITRRLFSRVERAASAPRTSLSTTLYELADEVADVRNIVLAALPGNPKAPFRPKKRALADTGDKFRIASELDLPEIIARMNDPRG